MTLARFQDLLRHRRRLVLAAGLALSLAVSSLAVAEEGDLEPAGEDEPLAAEPMLYVPDDEVIVFSFPDVNGEFTTDCSAALTPADADTEDGVEPAETTEGDDGDTDDTEIAAYSTLVDGCYVASVVGPNGQTNHGQTVRAVVHALKNMDLESLGYEGPRGHIVREIAGSDFGKDGGEDEPDGDDLDGLQELGSEPTSAGSHPGRGNAKGKNK